LRRCCHEVEIDAEILDVVADRRGDSSPKDSADQAVRQFAMLKSLLNASRFLVLAAVLGALAGAAALFTYGLRHDFVLGVSATLPLSTLVILVYLLAW
jgi:uncharacterized membrane protein YqhA